MGKECFGCKSTQDKIGILVANLGTPDAPTAKALRPYLKQFLSDRRVIEVNRVVWWFILRFVVLTLRPAKSAALYKRIWTDKGSPLLVITKKQTRELAKLVKSMPADIEVAFGMRYGKPSLESAIDHLIEQGASKILLLPMYPHYSATTTGSTYDAVFKHLLKRRLVPTLKVVEPYYRHPLYIDSLVKTIEESCAEIPNKPEKLVLSYHGIPQTYVKKGDPYCCMCTETTRALLPSLKAFKGKDVIHTYQSQFGRDPWLQPYTDVVIKQLAMDGVKRIAIACPGFTADCLETLDEMGNEGKELFLEHGGEEFTLIPCLNAHPVWMSALKSIVSEEIDPWLKTVSCSEQFTNPVICPLTKVG